MNYNTACCVTPSATPRRSKRDTRTGHQHSIPLAPPTHHSPCPAYTPTHSIPLAPPTHHPMPPKRGGQTTPSNIASRSDRQGPNTAPLPGNASGRHCPASIRHCRSTNRRPETLHAHRTSGQCRTASISAVLAVLPPSHGRALYSYSTRKKRSNNIKLLIGKQRAV